MNRLNGWSNTVCNTELNRKTGQMRRCGYLPQKIAARQEEAIDQLQRKSLRGCVLCTKPCTHAKSLEAAMFVRAVWNFLEAIDARKQLA